MSKLATTPVDKTWLVNEIMTKITNPIFEHMLYERQLVYEYVKIQTEKLEAEIKNLKKDVKSLEEKIKNMNV